MDNFFSICMDCEYFMKDEHSNYICEAFPDGIPKKFLLRKSHIVNKECHNGIKFKFYDIFKRLITEEQVICRECSKGVYRPVKKKDEPCYNYVCDVCGAHFVVEPMIEVK